MQSTTQSRHVFVAADRLLVIAFRHRAIGLGPHGPCQCPKTATGIGIPVTFLRHLLKECQGAAPHPIAFDDPPPRAA